MLLSKTKNFTNECDILERVKNGNKEILGMIKKDYLDNFNIEIFGAEKISRGYYISSKTRITYNAKSLMERSLYLSSGNRSGKYCHKCGKESETTIEEPLCEDCK